MAQVVLAARGGAATDATELGSSQQSTLLLSGD